MMASGDTDSIQPVTGIILSKFLRYILRYIHSSGTSVQKRDWDLIPF